MDVGKQFLCIDCSTSTLENSEYYMVWDNVWEEAFKPENPIVTDPTQHGDVSHVYPGMLCVKCLEERLGRELTPSDFTPAPINRMYGSDLLIERRTKTER